LNWGRPDEYWRTERNCLLGRFTTKGGINNTLWRKFQHVSDLHWQHKGPATWNGHGLFIGLLPSSHILCTSHLLHWHVPVKYQLVSLRL
jgi:hypothetical protein